MPDPSHIGKYRVERRLGQGGMGTVYLAHDTRIGRHVAIKVLRVDDEETRQRFEVEAQSAGRLKHPNIVTIHDYGDYEGNPCLVMEYVEGDTFAALINRGPSLAFSRRLELMEQVCRGLGYAHRASIVHRDIKPSNLMVDGEGVLKILDFGIARMVAQEVTRVGHVIGTAAYMAPEQIRGERVDARCDIFAVGLVLYEFLMGKRAFAGDSDHAMYHQILTGTPEPFTHPNPQLTASMAPIFETVLAKDPACRYQDVETLGADLARVRRSLPAEASGSTTTVATPIERPSTTPPPIVFTPPVVPPSPVMFPSPTPQSETPGNLRSATPKGRRPWEPHIRPVTTPPPLAPPEHELSGPADAADSFELSLRPETPAPSVMEVRLHGSPFDSDRRDRERGSPAAFIAAGIGLVALMVAGVAYFAPSVRDRAGRDSGIGNASSAPTAPQVPSSPARPNPEPSPSDSAPATLATPAPAPVHPPQKEGQSAIDPRKPRVDPRLIESRLAIASRLVEEGHYDRAIQEYEAILRADPRNAAAAAALAEVRSAKGAELTALRARHVAERVLEGQRFHSEGQYDAAIAAYQAALLLDPKDEQALAGIAQARRAKGGS